MLSDGNFCLTVISKRNKEFFLHYYLEIKCQSFKLSFIFLQIESFHYDIRLSLQIEMFILSTTNTAD